MRAINVLKASNASASVVKSPLPPPVARALEKFGADVALARRRRRFSQASMAERVGVSVATLRRLEKGEPSIALGTVARLMQVLGELDKLADLIDTAKDDLGLMLMDEQLPRRIRAKKPTAEPGAL